MFHKLVKSRSFVEQSHTTVSHAASQPGASISSGVHNIAEDEMQNLPPPMQGWTILLFLNFLSNFFLWFG